MMDSLNEPADPIAKGIIPSLKQNLSDLFVWKQRVVVINNFGEESCEWQAPEPLKNPVGLFAQLSARDWIFFIYGLLAWTADAFDYHAISIQTTKFAAYFKTNNTEITAALTLTLLLRSVGALGFGLACDRFGRKWPMVINLLIVGLLQIATIYSRTFHEFLAVRSLFGLFMGGVYGPAIAMALENCPVNARGLMSGILQQGYSLGYVLVACANLGVGGSTDSWKTVLWAGSGLSLGVGVLRIFFPESKQFILAKENGHAKITAAAFWRDTKIMLVQNWKISIYCVVLMTWFNFYSHTTQDSYTTFMLQSKGLNNAAASRASIWMKTGSIFGGSIIGFLCQFCGRRRAMVVSAIISGCLIPAWILPRGEMPLSASGFFLQFCVQGSWGVIPIHLNELSPPAFRALFPGLTYQLGNMISSPAAQIVNALAEKHFVKDAGGPHVKAYGPVMAIATGIIAFGIVCTVSIGPEKRGRRFEEAPIAGTRERLLDKDVETGGVEDKTTLTEEVVELGKK